MLNQSLLLRAQGRAVSVGPVALDAYCSLARQLGGGEYSAGNLLNRNLVLGGKSRAILSTG